MRRSGCRSEPCICVGPPGEMPHPRALWRGRGPPRHPWLVAVALWLAVAWGSGGDDGAPRNLKCFKACCCGTEECRPKCSWEAGGHMGAVYILHLWYPDHPPGERHATFETGNATSLFLKREHVYMEVKVTVWVESWVGEGLPPLRSNNLTLVINQAVRLEAPTKIKFSRSRGHMTLTWNETHNCCASSRENQVRMRTAVHANWTARVGMDDLGVPLLVQQFCHSGALRNLELATSLMPPPNSCLKSPCYVKGTGRKG
ncbi:uncharacterized protein LOC128405875 [Podarcis raffonei]|uniref:uncharacterized protein LOC128405875 n=1 Tax=Podarcis raffonei TaxID=65483 RepID=UPI0023293769|nr:uncharacterized protein LOC128405875 [Podarcis raffonei]